MPKQLPILAASLCFLFLSLHAQALECRAIITPGALVRRFTNYSPSAGGINGRCGRSASGLDPCQYTLEDHLNGRTPMVIGAVPQVGGTANLFGGLYQAFALQSALRVNSCIRVCAGDRYGTSSNNLSKMDISTKQPRSPEALQIQTASGEMRPIGRCPGIPAPVRRVTRNPNAVSRMPTPPIPPTSVPPRGANST